MIDVTPELAAFFESGVKGFRVDLLTLTLASGTVLRWSGTNGPVPLPDGRLFQAGPLIERSRVRVAAGVEVDELELQLTPRAADIVGGVPLMQYAIAGGLRGCVVLLEWAYFDEARVFKGVMPKFAGSGSPSAFENGAIHMQAKSELERLLVMMPRDVYQPGCLATVYDATCGASKSAKTVTGAVTSVTAGVRNAFTTGRAEAAGYFNQGVLRFTSGACSGFSRMVRSFAAGAFDFALPFPFDIQVGDTFAVYPGCNRSMTDPNGCPKFFSSSDVKLHFRGQPFIPSPEVAT